MSQFGPVSFAFQKPTVGPTTFSQAPQAKFAPSPNISQDSVVLSGVATNGDPMKALVHQFGRASTTWRQSSSTSTSEKPVAEAKPYDRSPAAVKAYNEKINQADPGTYTNKYGEKIPLPKGFGMSAQEVIAHNKTVTSAKDMILPPDRSGDSVLAYNTRIQELEAAKPKAGSNVSHPIPSWSPAAATTVRNWTPTPETAPPLPKNHGMSTQDVIAHNKTVTNVKDMILPPDRSGESVLAYNTRVQELESASKPKAGNGVGYPVPPWSPSTSATATTVRNWTPTPSTPPPLPKGYGMSAQDVIAHNKTVNNIKDLIAPLDRSGESVLAYNTRVQELS